MVFKKTFPTLSVEQVATLARHAYEVGVALESNIEAIFPSLVESDSTSISYALADCSRPMSTSLFNRTCTVDDMRKAGSILRSIHRVPGLMHADFVSHNLFFSQDFDCLVVIDPHPPEYVPFSADYLYGHQVNEISRFVFAQLSNSSFKRSVGSFGYQLKMTKAFLEGYGQPIPAFKAHLIPTWLCAREVFYMKLQGNYSLLRAGAHATAGFLLTLVLLRISL